jgi:hypothetical protein
MYSHDRSLSVSTYVVYLWKLLEYVYFFYVAKTAA